MPLTESDNLVETARNTRNISNEKDLMQRYRERLKKSNDQTSQPNGADRRNASNPSKTG